MKQILMLSALATLLLLTFACSDSSSDDNNMPAGDQDVQADGDGEGQADGDDEELGDVGELIEKGKEALGENDPESAAGFFDEALTIEEENTSAVFGLCLAQLQTWIGVLDGFISQAQEGGNGPMPAKALAGYKAEEDENPGEQIIRMIGDIYGQSKAQLDRFAMLKEHEDFEFRMDSFPIVISERTLIDMHSEWDLADVFHMNALQNIMHMLMSLAYSQALDADWDTVDFEETADDDIDTAIENIAKFMSDNPGFLNLDPETGDARWAEAKASMRAFAADMLKGAKLMAAEEDDQSDDVYIHNEDTMIKSKDHYGMQGSFISGKDQVLLLWSGKEYSPKATFSSMVSHLDGNAELRVRLEDDILMLMGVFADFLIEAVSIEVMADMFGVELSPEIQALIDLYFGNRDDGEDIPEKLISLLPNLIGMEKNVVQFDFFTFFERPFPFRELLTNIGPNPFSGNPVFLQSVECARLGFGAAQLAAGDEISIKLHDRGAANVTAGSDNDDVQVTVVCRNVPEEGDPTVVDSETVTLDESSDLEAYFEGTLASASVSAADEATSDDGTLQIMAGCEVTATYIDDGDGEDDDAYDILSTYNAEGASENVFGYTMSCQDGTKRDWGHFAGAEYANAYIIPDPPAAISYESPYPAIEHDGVRSNGVYAPLRSPSINGLVWLDARKAIGVIAEQLGFPEGFHAADTRSMNAFTQSMQENLAGLGEAGGEGGGGLPF